MEASYYGKAMTTAASGGIVIVKTSRLLVVALYTEPATAAEAIPLVHRFVDDQLANLLGDT